MRKILATVAAVLLLIGSFCLPSFAASQPSIGTEHTFRIYVPRRELILDSGGLGDTDTLDRNYINAFELWKTFTGRPTSFPVGTSVSYTVKVYKREVYDNGQYVGGIDVTITDSYTGNVWRQDYSVHYINNSVIPTGIAWRIRGAVDPFVSVLEDVAEDGSRWHYESEAQYSFTLEAGKSSTYTMYLYNPKVEWLTFDQLREDQSILEDYYSGVSDFYDRVWDDWIDAPKTFTSAVSDVFDLTGPYLPVTAAVLGLVGVALIFKGAKN